MATVRVVGVERTLEVEPGTPLLKACRSNNVNLFWGPWAQAFNCRGLALCNLCPVRVVEGADRMTPRTAREAKRLAGRPDDWRLACHAKVQGEVIVESFPELPLDQRFSEEALRFGMLSADERETDLERRREVLQDARAAEREAARKMKPAKRGLLARVTRRKPKEPEERTPAPAASTSAEEAEEALATNADDDEKQPAKRRLGFGKRAAPMPSEGAPPDAEPDTKTAAPGRRFGLQGRKS